MQDEGRESPETPPAASAPPADPPPVQDSAPADSGELPDFELEWDFRGGEPPGMDKRIPEVNTKDEGEPKD